MIEPTPEQQAVVTQVCASAPDRWVLHSYTFLTRARTIILAWCATDPPEEFGIYIGKKTTYESVQKAYPDLPESPVVATS